ncbi:hypothetical protein ERX46_07060 [Brumimicrobium glaciale]|uniref:LPS export ABC transporter periplasmic protein LptC n=1 Tax=Brumimicrobium glaciale TaxID=200475 RepID=A0A4Q4KST8_9FLAO|nr:hypothetical protein [Brumimicrobium glaciale]RYM35129.1 hypothetical protein ERX46_07060 [Brumimicrobium glaciale]
MKAKFIFPFTLLLIIGSSCATSTQKDKVAFKVYSQEETKIMKVKRSGAVIVTGEKVGFLRNDGVLTDLKNDTLAYKNAEGVVYSKTHQTIGKIDKNDAIEIDSSTKLVWTADGKLQIRDNEFIRVEPNFKAFYHKTAFLFIIYASINSSDEEIDIEESE